MLPHAGLGTILVGVSATIVILDAPLVHLFLSALHVSLDSTLQAPSARKNAETETGKVMRSVTMIITLMGMGVIQNAS